MTIPEADQRLIARYVSEALTHSATEGGPLPRDDSGRSKYHRYAGVMRSFSAYLQGNNGAAWPPGSMTQR
jgi:hypothetical protein